MVGEGGEKRRESPPLHSATHTHTEASSRLEIFMKRVSALAIGWASIMQQCRITGVCLGGERGGGGGERYIELGLRTV